MSSDEPKFPQQFTMKFLLLLILLPFAFNQETAEQLQIKQQCIQYPPYGCQICFNVVYNSVKENETQPTENSTTFVNCTQSKYSQENSSDAFIQLSISQCIKNCCGYELPDSNQELEISIRVCSLNFEPPLAVATIIGGILFITSCFGMIFGKTIEHKQPASQKILQVYQSFIYNASYLKNLDFFLYIGLLLMNCLQKNQSNIRQVRNANSGTMQQINPEFSENQQSRPDARHIQSSQINRRQSKIMLPSIQRKNDVQLEDMMPQRPQRRLQSIAQTRKKSKVIPVYQQMVQKISMKQEESGSCNKLKEEQEPSINFIRVKNRDSPEIEKED